MIELLWIAIPLPGCKDAKAGHATYRYLFEQLYNDERFSIRAISYESSADLERSRKRFPGAVQVVVDTKGTPKIKKLSSLKSSINPISRYGGMIGSWTASRIIQFARQWKREGYDPDAIILSWTQSVVLARDIRALFPRAVLIADEQDVSFVGYKRRTDRMTGLLRAWWTAKTWKEKRAELNALGECDVVVPQNRDNALLLSEEGLSCEIVDWFVPYYKDMSSLCRQPSGSNILFYGSMERPENYLSAKWFIDNVMPLIPDRDLRFIVLGGNPHESLLNLNDNRVVVTGFVDDVAAYFESSICFVAPLVLGAGIKVKVLEAMSAGLPVLTNDIGIEGIGAKKGVEYLHCEIPVDYAAAIEFILDDAKAAEAIGCSAKQHIRNNFSYQDCASRLKELIVLSRDRKES